MRSRRPNSLWTVALIVVFGAASIAAVRRWQDSARARSSRSAAFIVGSASIAGIVIDFAHKPIGSARVCAFPYGLDIASSAVTICSTADANGRYSLAHLATRSYIVSAYAEGFAADSALGVPLPLLAAGEFRTGAEIALQRGGAPITGTVVDATGRPVPHALVRGENSGAATAVAMAVEADDVGRFTLSFPPGPIVLAALAETYAPARTGVNSPSVGVRLVLVGEARARGVVVFAADGKPAPNVEVRAEPAGRGSAFFESSRTDASGAFDIRSLEPGPYTFVAAGEGLWGERREPIELYPRRTVDGLRIEVRPVAQVLGRILREGDERPCDHGRAALGPPDPRYPPAHDVANGAPEPPVPTSVTTDIEAQGMVHFSAVPPGHYHVNVECLDHLLKQGPRALDVGAQTLSNITWHVGRGANLHVLAVDDRDRPVAQVGFSVRYPQWTPGNYTVVVAARSDGDGQFDTGHVLLPGVYDLMTSHSLRAEPVTVQVHEGDDFRAKLKFAGSSTIEVLVRDRSGRPLDELMVFAQPAASIPDAARAPEVPRGPPAQVWAARLGFGHYRIGPLTAGRYEVRIEDGVNPAMSGGTYDLSDGESVDGSVELDRGGQIRGQVLDDHGAPVADASVRATAESEGSVAAHTHTGPTWSEARGRVLTDGKGHFVIGGLSLAGGSYELRAEASGSAMGLARGVKPGGEDASIALPPPGSLAGEVDDGCGKAPVRIMAANTNSGQQLTLTLPPSTRSFLLRDLAPGNIRLEAVCADWSAGASLTTELLPGQNVRDLRLTPAPRSVTMSPPSRLTSSADLFRADQAKSN